MKSLLKVIKNNEWRLIPFVDTNEGDYIAVFNKTKYTSIYKVINPEKRSMKHVSQSGNITSPSEEQESSYMEVYKIPYCELPDFLK